MKAASSFFAEFLATAILAMMVLAMTDKRNLSPVPGLLPVAIFLMIMGIGTSLGMQTGASLLFPPDLGEFSFIHTKAYALNPARDLGPRIFLAMAGYGKAIFTFKRYAASTCHKTVD